MSTSRSTRSGAHPLMNKAVPKKLKRKAVPGEEEFLHMIELASFEVNVDPYRGIQTLFSHRISKIPENGADSLTGSSNIDIVEKDGNSKKKNDEDASHLDESASSSIVFDCTNDIWKSDDNRLQLTDEKKGHLNESVTSLGAADCKADICKNDNALQNDEENNGSRMSTAGWWRVHCSIVEDIKSSTNENEFVAPEIPESGVEPEAIVSSAEDIVHKVTGTCCPSLIRWTSRAIQDQQKRRAKRKRKSSLDAVPSQCFFLGRRGVYDSSKVCSCDFNPFCLGSLGGVMDDILNNWASTLRPSQKSPSLSNTVDTDSVIVLQDDSISLSDEATKPDAVLYLPETSQRLKVVRKYSTVDANIVRSYLQSKLKEFTSELSLDECVNRLQALHDSLIFVNPLHPHIRSTDEQLLFLSMPPGIENLGATCYLNTQLQCLAQNLVFVEGIISWRPADDDTGNDRMSSVLSLFQDLFLRMNAGPLSVVNTLEFSNALGLDHFEQQDPNEFSRLLFDRIHDSFKGSSSNKNLADLLPRLFQGVMVYETCCLECGSKSKRTEEFMDLNLPIVRPESKDPESTKYFSSTFPNVDTEVQYCLNQYCTAELLDGENQYFCDRCQCKRNARREVAFQTLPPVLNVQLCRYVFNREKLIKTKLSEKVLLPVCLNLRSVENEDLTKVSEHQYFLCAVMRHKGTSAYSGHYVAEAMDWLSGQWYEFNDQNVVRLTEGPSCSFHPSLMDLEDHQTSSKDGEKPFKSTFNGSQDAYNMYYVEETFLAKCILDSLRHGKSKDFSIESDSIVTERSKYYDSLRQLCIDDRIATNRLNKRREAICNTIFPSLSAFQLTNSIDLFWVETEFLQKFMSCTDRRLNFEESKLSSQSVLQHRKYLCSHEFPGLHPRIARRGKLLSRQSYDAYVRSLNEERLTFIGDTASCSDIPVSDCLIGPANNLVCDDCLMEYRSELSQKLKLAELLVRIFHDLDQKETKCSLNCGAVEPTDSHANEYTYIVSRKFATWFRSKVSRFMKHNASVIAAESVAGGLDSIDFSEFEMKNSENLSSCSSVDESVAVRVNGSVTCRHGNFVSTTTSNKILDVSWSTWSMIKNLFPEAIEHKRKRRDDSVEDVSHSDCLVHCAQCLEEGMAKTSARSNLSDLAKFCRRLNSLNGLSKDEIIELSKLPTCIRLYLVHRRGITAWHKFLSFLTRRDGVWRDLPLPSGQAPSIYISNVDDSTLSIVDRSRLDFLSAMVCPITCSQHGKAMRYALFQNVDIHDSHHPYQLNENICVFDEHSYLAYTSYIGAAAVMLYPSETDSSIQGGTIQDFISDGADFFDRGLGHSSFHPSCIPVCRINGKVDTDRFVVANEKMAVLFQLEEASCCIDSCIQVYNDWHKIVTNDETASIPIDIDNEVEQVSVTPSCVDIKVLDVEVDGHLDYVLSFLVSCAGAPISSELEESQPYLRRSSRKRISRYPVGCILDEETVEIRLDNNIAALRLLLLERCTKGTHFSLDHSLKLIIENSKGVSALSGMSGIGNDVIKAIDLPFDVNNKTIREMCEGCIGIPFDKSMSLVVIRQANVEKSSVSIPSDDLMGHLLSLASLSMEKDQSNSTKRSKRSRTEKGFSGTFLSSFDTVKSVNSLDDEVVVEGCVEQPKSSNSAGILDPAQIKPVVGSISPNVSSSMTIPIVADKKDVSCTSVVKNGKSLSPRSPERVSEDSRNRNDNPALFREDKATRDCFEDDDSDTDIELLQHSPFSKKPRSQEKPTSNQTVSDASTNPKVLSGVFESISDVRSNGNSSSHGLSNVGGGNQALVTRVVQLLLSNPDVHNKNEEICRVAAENAVQMNPTIRNANDLVDSAYSLFLEWTLP